MTGDIALVLADVDGTLVTDRKVLTDAAQDAVAELRRAGIGFAVTSGRPPRGMAMLTGPLAIETPLAGFNGGVMMAPDLETVVASHDLADAAVRTAIALLEDHGLDVWIYTHASWLVRDAAAPHVDREARTVRFQPEVVPRFAADTLRSVVKIVGVTDDRARMERCERDAQRALDGAATAACSQPYYLDVTHTAANKGAVVETLARLLRIDPARIATIGDMPNDVAMFERSGLSIAMGNAGDAVKAKARLVTDSNENEGFAKAVRRFILGETQP
ncbi:MAG: HAD family phosphatase [Rhodospirillales bacterium]|jgi:Cof subfamily protein (haloacid dehalogenase superfamily)|nr:HAD family phosphatase [Rhodospirillales bacterium]